MNSVISFAPHCPRQICPGARVPEPPDLLLWSASLRHSPAYNSSVTLWHLQDTIQTPQQTHSLLNLASTLSLWLLEGLQVQALFVLLNFLGLPGGTMLSHCKLLICSPLCLQTSPSPPHQLLCPTLPMLAEMHLSKASWFNCISWKDYSSTVEAQICLFEGKEKLLLSSFLQKQTKNYNMSPFLFAVKQK